MNDDLSNSARRVQRAIEAAGITARVAELPQSTRTASDAAAAIGCSVGQIAKSLVFRMEPTDTPLLVIASGANRVDERLVGSLLGTKLGRADAEFARSATGFAIGGIPPLGHEVAIETLIDEALLQYEVVWAAAGTPNAVFAIAPQDLVRITGARVVAVAK